ncbi:MAG: hypothetical protein IT212_07645 [Bacteroidia bacterium]|nr:hypothetical protein [Bacteroidia bacterium]
MSTKKNSAKPVAEVGVIPDVAKEEMYYEMKDGKGMTHKIANMNNPLVCRRKGVIEIEAIRRGKDKQANISICTTFDARNRIIFGIPTGIDNETNKIIYKRFYLPEFKTYNLSNADEAEEWAIIKHHEVLNGPRPTYKIYDTEAIAQAEINEISLIEEAVSIAKGMKLKDWVPCARFFGHDPAGMTPTMLQSEIMKLAKNTPSELIDYWGQESRPVVDIFNAAKAVGLIHHDHVKGWLFKKTLPLGSTQEQAMRYVIKDTVFAKSLQTEVDSLDITTESIASGKSNRRKTSFDEMEESKDVFDLKIKAKLLGIKEFDKLTDDQLRKRVKAAEAVVLDEELTQD